MPIPTKSGHTLKVTVGEKGGNWRRLVVHGTPGHGSRPFRTDNALVTAARVIQRLAEYRPQARILDAWRGYVEALDFAPGLTEPSPIPAGCGRPRAISTISPWPARLTPARTPRSRPTSPMGAPR